jgi:hypothetical protein
LHRDGYPHFHVLLVGPGIAKREILGFIRHIWSEVHQLGNIDIKVIKNLKHSVNYLLKYLVKDPQRIDDNKKLFTSSKDALEKTVKKDWLATKFTMGDCFKENDIIHTKEIDISGLSAEEMAIVIEENLGFFDCIQSHDLLDIFYPEKK